MRMRLLGRSGIQAELCTNCRRLLQSPPLYNHAQSIGSIQHQELRRAQRLQARPMRPISASDGRRAPGPTTIRACHDLHLPAIQLGIRGALIRHEVHDDGAADGDDLWCAGLLAWRCGVETCARAPGCTVVGGEDVVDAEWTLFRRLEDGASFC